VIYPAFGVLAIDAPRSSAAFYERTLSRYLQERAKSKGIEVNRLVNDMLKREIDLIEAVK